LELELISGTNMQLSWAFTASKLIIGQVAATKSGWFSRHAACIHYVGKASSQEELFLWLLTRSGK
jgi:hypothetical protein